jgi:protein-disulfide isomerase
MGQKILVVLLLLSFCFLGFSVGRYSYVPAVGPNISIAKDLPDLTDSPEVERALTMAVIASSKTIAKNLAKSLEKQDLTREAYMTFIKAARSGGAAGAKGAKKAEADPNKVYDVKLGDAPVRGDKNAPVTIVAFSEFQCPFCGRAEKTISALLEKYKGKVNYVFRSKLLPSHSKAPLAHAAAYAAGKQGKFWEMHDKIFEDQRTLTEEAFLGYATALGLNIKQFTVDLKSDDIKKEYEDDMAESDRIGVRSTPTFFVNGKMVRGAKPQADFEKVIDAELAKK